MLNWLKKKMCSHLFKAVDMQLRDEHGVVRWPCKRCGKVFEAECGLDILKHGQCDGNWNERKEGV